MHSPHPHPDSSETLLLTLFNCAFLLMVSVNTKLKTGVQSAPLWDGKSQRFVGMFTGMYYSCIHSYRARRFPHIRKTCIIMEIWLWFAAALFSSKSSLFHQPEYETYKHAHTRTHSLSQ
jgi:hypothetical protein